VSPRRRTKSYKTVKRHSPPPSHNWTGKDKGAGNKTNTKPLLRLDKTLRFADFPFVALEDDSPIKPDWISGPCSTTGYSDPVVRANFDTLVDTLDHADPTGGHWDTAIYDHFAAGWLEVIFVEPGGKCAKLCDETRAFLAEFPVLDEHLVAVYTAEEEAQKEQTKLDKLKNTTAVSANNCTPQPERTTFVDSYGISWIKRDNLWYQVKQDTMDAK